VLYTRKECRRGSRVRRCQGWNWGRKGKKGESSRKNEITSLSTCALPLLFIVYFIVPEQVFYMAVLVCPPSFLPCSPGTYVPQTVWANAALSHHGARLGKQL